ncbi:hypothetical protein HK101_003503, partial [Irineochytrium annulatum]
MASADVGQMNDRFAGAPARRGATVVRSPTNSRRDEPLARRTPEAAPMQLLRSTTVSKPFDLAPIDDLLADLNRMMSDATAIPGDATIPRRTDTGPARERLQQDPRVDSATYEDGKESQQDDRVDSVTFETASSSHLSVGSGAGDPPRRTSSSRTNEESFGVSGVTALRLPPTVADDRWMQLDRRNDPQDDDNPEVGGVGPSVMELLGPIEGRADSGMTYGFLFKLSLSRSHNQTKWKKRFFILHAGEILLYRSDRPNERPISAIAINSSSDTMVSEDAGKYILEVRTERTPDDSHIRSDAKASPRIWRLQSSEENQIMEWLIAVQDTIERCIDSGIAPAPAGLAASRGAGPSPGPSTYSAPSRNDSDLTTVRSTPIYHHSADPKPFTSTADPYYQYNNKPAVAPLTPTSPAVYTRPPPPPRSDPSPTPSSGRHRNPVPLGPVLALLDNQQQQSFAGPTFVHATYQAQPMPTSPPMQMQYQHQQAPNMSPQMQYNQMQYHQYQGIGQQQQQMQQMQQQQYPFLQYAPQQQQPTMYQYNQRGPSSAGSNG